MDPITVTSIGSGTTGNKKSVTFGSIEVREYSRCLGDHPSTSSGPPISLGWDYITKGRFNLFDYEQQRQSFRNLYKNRSFALSPKRRKELLLEHSDATIQQMKDVISDIKRIRFQRRVSIDWHEFDGVTMIWESCCRKFKRLRKGILSKKSREQQRLWTKVQPIQIAAHSMQEKKNGIIKNTATLTTIIDEDEDCPTACSISEDSFCSETEFVIQEISQ